MIENADGKLAVDRAVTCGMIMGGICLTLFVVGIIAFFALHG